MAPLFKGRKKGATGRGLSMRGQRGGVSGAASASALVDEIEPREDRPADRPLTDVRASLFVERDSQKAIVIGKAGSRLKEVGTKARREIEALLGVPVFLDIRVKVAKDWQKDAKQLRRLEIGRAHV